jgi:amidophosphoribosyltransferase
MSDSELITQALCLNPPDGETDGPNWIARIKHVMKLSPLSYALVLMYGDRIYGVRDPYGNRPLCLGKLVPAVSGKRHLNNQGILNGKIDEDVEGWVISSESSGFLAIGARYLREVEPGEIVELTKHGVKSLGHVDRPDDKLPAFCIFEYVYFARPDSIFEGKVLFQFGNLYSV